MTDIPDTFLKYAESYHAGWITRDGTLHATDSHAAFRPRGYISANRRHKTALRAQDKAAGRISPTYGRDLSTYHHAWNVGAIRLCVRPSQITLEYSRLLPGEKEQRPPLREIFTDKQARSLAALSARLGADIRLQVSSRDGFHEHKIRHPEVSTRTLLQAAVAS